MNIIYENANVSVCAQCGGTGILKGGPTDSRIDQVCPCKLIATTSCVISCSTRLTSAQKATLENFPSITSYEDCPHCDGSGELQPDVQCKSCIGTGIKDFDSLNNEQQLIPSDKHKD